MSQNFALFSKICEILERIGDEKNEMFDILFIYVVDKNYYLGPTCNSKLQIIKFSFVWSAHPTQNGGVPQLQKFVSLQP